MCGREPVGFSQHPVLELAGEFGQRLLGARHGIVGVLLADPPQYLARRIGLGDDVMGREGLDLDI